MWTIKTYGVGIGLVKNCRPERKIVKIYGYCRKSFLIVAFMVCVFK